MKVWAIMTECADYFYGWSVDSLFMSEEDARAEMARLADINKGISYDVQEWDVKEPAKFSNVSNQPIYQVKED